MCQSSRFDGSCRTGSEGILELVNCKINVCPDVGWSAHRIEQCNGGSQVIERRRELVMIFRR